MSPRRLCDTGNVPIVCTCGARPPEDAKFCHRCGRPLSGEPEPEPEPVAPEPLLPSVALAPQEPVKIGWNNRTAVRVALAAAVVSTVLGWIPLPALFLLLWQPIILVGSGFLSVFWYQKATGEFLNVRSGAKLGLLTGILHFVITVIFFTLSMVALQFQGGGAMQRFRRAMEMSPGYDPKLESLFNNPVAMGMMMLFALLVMFGFLAVLSSLGGALGSKILEKEERA
jgi:ABC-type cobalt transport system substrate-binding protein